MNNKFITYSLSIIFSIILFFVILFTATELVVYNVDYYKWHYNARGIEKETGMNIDNLMVVTKVFIEYLNGNLDTLDVKATIENEYREVFGQREKEHMVDVKNLALGAKAIRNYGFVFLVLVSILTLLLNREIFFKIIFSIKYIFLSCIGVMLLLSGLLISDFNKYFTIFHEIFFKNDLWLLDPETDILINMVPEIFFFTTAMLVVMLFLTLSAIIIMSIELVKKKIKIKTG